MPGNRIATYPALLATEAAFTALPLQAFPPPWWTDITARALGPWSTQRGTDYWLARTTAGLMRPILDNRDGAFDGDNTAGPYWPNVQPYRGLRERMRFGPNQLTADQATAGEYSALTGPLPLQDLNVINDAGYPLAIVASGSAFQGAQVYQATLPGGATTFATVLLLQRAPVIPRQTYSFQAQARITSGNSVSTQVSVLWYDNLGNSLGAVSGGAQTLTSGAGIWTQLTAANVTAPAGAFSAWLKVQIASGTLSGSTVWQVDGLQWEASASATTWQQPGVLGGNLLPQAVATGTASIDPTKDSAANYFASATGSVAQAFNLPAAPNGATSAVAWTSPSGTGSSSPLYAGAVAAGNAVDGPVQDCIQVAAGSAYSASVYLDRASSADATVQMKAGLRWFDATGALISTSTGTAVTVAAGSWVRASLANATAPAGAVWGRPYAVISSPASTTATNVVYATGWQVEQAAAVSTWVDPGPTFFAWTGFFDQYPQAWRLSGTYGETDAVGVDLLAGLAQYDVLDPFVEEVLTYNPNFFYPLNDPAGSTACADITGNRPAAPLTNAPIGGGSVTFGNSVTAASPSGLFQGGAGPVATFNNNDTTPLPNQQFPVTYIDLSATTASPGPPSTGGWTRILAFRAAAAPGGVNDYHLWASNPVSWATSGASFSFVILPSGQLQISIHGGNASPTTPGNVCDGNWHLIGLGHDSMGGNTASYLDSGAFQSGTTAGQINGFGIDVVGALFVPGQNSSGSGAIADIAFVIELPINVTAAQWTNLYNSFRTASSGEGSGARVARLLNWIGYNGPVSIDAGSTQTMGPASDLARQKALSGFNAIVDTENGDGYASAAGTLTFRGRSVRYNTTPAFVFGSNTQWGEWPYRAGDGDLLAPTDTVNTYNIVPTQQYSTGQVATARDRASGKAFFPRTFPTRTVNSTSFAEVQAAGQYLLEQLKTPRKRLAQMILDVGSVPGLWRVAAQLEKGVRIRVMIRQPGRASAQQLDCFVERVEWAADPRAGGAAAVRVEASPADTANYLVLAALHTTLNAQATSGQNQATINALPDAFVNTLSQSLPQGYQLRFEPGTPRDETLALTPSGIPFTGVGYQTAVLTFTTTFAFTHAAGSVVCEPLPAGFTDPTAWDGQVSLAASSTTILSGGASGTNTVTVGPLADSAVNALGSTWNTGDLLWISPNNPATFEGYNRLHPNVATAGEGVLPLPAGTFGYTVGLFTAYASNALQVTASATAWQGANVWQVTVPGASATGQDLVSVLKLQCTAGLAFTGSMYVRSATAGQNPHVQPYIAFYDANYNQIGSSTTGTAVTLTGGPSAAWTRVTANATAPAGAVFARIGVTLTVAPSGSWAAQADGLQFEQAAAASVFGVTPQVKSVAATVPGYSSCVITLATNLLDTHTAGDTVCDPLPPGNTVPPANPARLAY